MYVVGTAGHVDHGKSTLIQALTGINPDRLPQEQERGMTIDLGFAWLTLPSGQEVSIIDVPGHERFVRNMLAGVGGIDMALLVVAADEGVMPQTREHLAILDLLNVQRGLVALTKADLVDDDLLELAEMETVEALEGTVLENASIITLSATTGQGLDQLLRQMDKILAETTPRADLGRPRLAVDRSFTVSGFGTVVTGTLIDGTLAIGQDVELVPSRLKGRIRGLQSHRQKLTEADPGRRLAVNISGVSYDQAQRGETVTIPGWLQPTTMLDARVKLLADAPRPMKHNARVSFHSHVSETGARIRLLDARLLQPGHEAWAQIHLTNPLPLVKGDFFVVRSTETTIGGGKVVDPFPRRHRPFTKSVLNGLHAMDEGTLEELILGAVEQWGPCDLTALAQRSNLTLADVSPVIEDLAAKGSVTLLGGDRSGPNSQVYSRRGWQRLKRQTGATLKDYHERHPLRRGIPKEEFRNRLGVSATGFPQLLTRLVNDQVVEEDAAVVRTPGYQAKMTSAQERDAQAYIGQLDANPFSPPTDGDVNPELLALLIDRQQVVKVDGSVVFSASAYRQMVDAVTRHIQDKGSITVAEARTLLDSSRKYVLPLLEYLDQQRLTRRTGDKRTLR